MWLTNLLRKLTQGPNVGETFRGYIGCYLFGAEATNSNQPEYIAAPTTLTQLEIEVHRHLQTFLETKGGNDTDIKAVQILLNHLPQKLQAHTASDMKHPFLTLNGVELFIRKGIRQRRKEGGEFIE